MENIYTDHFTPYTVTKSKHYLLLFLIWPFLAFITALTNYSNKESRRVVYIFLIYYGLTYVTGELGGAGADSERYALNLKANALLPFSDFFKIVVGLYATDTSVDIVEPFISFIVSRLTDNYHILFAVYSAIFGFFYLKSINLLSDRYRENPGWNSLIYMAFFVVILPITAINGFRMWTAAWIFFYGAYHVVLYRDPRYLLIALGSSLVHWSFLSANVILVIYFFAGNRNYIYLPVAILSFFSPHLLDRVFQTISLKLGGALQDRYSMYSDTAYVITTQEGHQQDSWFLVLDRYLILYYLLFALIVIQLRYRNLMKEKSERNLFSFLLLFLSFVNFGMGIPSFGGRFQTVFFLFITVYIFLFFMKLPGGKVNLLTILGLFPMLLYAAIAFRQGSDGINAWIFAPGLGLPLFVPGLSLTDLIFR